MKNGFKISRLVIGLAVMPLLVSCSQDRLPKLGNFDVKDAGMISFTAGMGDMETVSRGGASGTSASVIDEFEIDGTGFTLSCEQSLLSDRTGDISTKGTPVNMDNFADVYGAFAVDAYGAFEEEGETFLEILPAIDSEGKVIEDEFGNYTYFADVPFTKNGDKWTISSEYPQYQSFYWPKFDYSVGTDPSNYIPLSFFAYAPTFAPEPFEGNAWGGVDSYFGPDNESVPAYYADGKVEFYHLLRYYDENSYDEDYKRAGARLVVGNDDAFDEPDCLIASTGVLGSPHTGIPVPLTFYHILSGIRFKVADDFPEGTKLNYIRFDDVWWDGYCTFDPNASGSTSADKVSWTFPSDCARASFRQNFNVEVAATRDFDNGIIQGGDMLYGDNVTKTFMMIPQSFGHAGDSPDAVICIGLETAEGEKEVKVRIPEGTMWQAGMLYTYSLSLTFNDNDDDADIEVVEDFEEPYRITELYYKENIKVENTATAIYYIRVAIVAYETNGYENVATWWKDEEQWLYTAHDAASLYEEYEDGIPDYDWDTWTYNTGNDWKKFGDYYYYRYPVEGSESTEILCDAIRVPCLTTRESEVDVISQGLPWNEGEDHKETVKRYWGEEVAAWLNDYPETNPE